MNLYFFIGTEAELIKVFPVIMECMQQGCICHVIASGQNDLTKSRIMQEIKLNGTFLELSKESEIEKSAKGLLKWFAKTHRSAVKKITAVFSKEELKGAPMIVHGDTVSTFMGAHIGKKLGCVVCHVEAGLRSHHLFNPFPEEIDRLLTSRYARMHFAPGEEPVKNLKKAKGKVINTEYNTILDSLRYSKGMPVLTEGITELQTQDYFVFVMHRQENLANKDFVREVLERIKQFATKRKCVLILHKITEVTLEEMGILEELKQNDNFVLLPRVDYFDFMKLLNGAQYVITDGGSNQEELHYMGKPCLIMRKTTERQEGIGQNAVLYGGNIAMMGVFEGKYQEYGLESLLGENSPSKMIAEELKGKL
ncbi:MAG: UDP-N-acetylglucosamine 2-epimerase [Lachnospiraceae bacterium]|nr:UDP-N-acetylglucosamine 2-epimerase [Lachnospiraceae bacterium]